MNDRGAKALRSTTSSAWGARRRFGRIAIANAGAYAYTDCAIEQAFRAVNELPR